MTQAHLLYAFLALLLWWVLPLRIPWRKARGDPLDVVVTSFAHIPIDARTLANGVIWCGGVSSGKTSTAARILVDILRSGYSAVLFTYKIEEPEHLEKLIRLAGVPPERVTRIGRGHMQNTLNCVAFTYQVTQSVEAVAELFEVMMAAAQQKAAAKEDATARFFSQMALTCVRHSCVILAAIDPSKLSFGFIGDFIARGPGMRYLLYPRTEQERAHVEAFQRTAWWQLKNEAERKLAAGEVAPERVKDVENAIAFFLTEFAEMPEKQKGSVISTITTMTSLFQFYPMRELFDTSSTIDPEMLEDGQRIWLLTDPGQQGIDRKIAQLVIKYTVQAHAQRRDTSVSKQRVLLWLDEYPQFAMQRVDASFQAIARQKLYSQVLLCQNFAQLKEAFGGEDEANDFLSNVRSRVCMACDEPWTTRWFADLLGKTTRFLPSPQHHHQKEPGIDWFGSNPDTPQWHSTTDYEVMPHEFGSLIKAGPPTFHGEAIVYIGGSKFSDGKTYARVMLKQLLA